MKQLFFVFVLFMLSSPAFATGDGNAILTFKDTLMVELTTSNQKVIVHIAEKKQTLFSIAKFYGLTHSELLVSNPKYKTINLQVGDKIKVPVPGKAIMKRMKSDFKRWKYAPVFYQAKEGETIYTISKKYFKTPVDTFLKRNHLPVGTTQLKSGQMLQVGWFNTSGVTPEMKMVDVKNDENLSVVESGDLTLTEEEKLLELYKKKFELQANYGKIVKNQGAALWQFNSKGSEAPDFFILHNQAKTNSIVELYNSINKKTVYAKVVGRIPEGSGKEIIAIVSKSVAKELGIRDPKFFIKIKYLE